MHQSSSKIEEPIRDGLEYDAAPTIRQKMNKRNTSLIIRGITLLAACGLAANISLAQNKVNATEVGNVTVDTTHPWYGARVGIIGDSISDPQVANGPEKYYWYMAREIGIIPCVVATNGREWNDVIRQANNLKSGFGDNIDAILILLGTNDFNAGVPIGGWFTEEYDQVEAANNEPKSIQTRRHRTPNLDPSTFKGRINIALDSLRSMYPEKQIILMTPLHRGLARLGERNIQPDENYTNRCGEYIDAYVNAVKEAENLWAVPVIDLNAISGLFPLNDTQKDYFLRDRDKLHPSDKGHERIAHALIAWLRCLAPGFGAE